MPIDSAHSTGEANIKKLAEIIRDMKFAMLTTVDPDGSVRSRPMATQEQEFDGDLWFFTSRVSGKIDSIKNDKHVNVVYANPDEQRYVSISGRAEINSDRNKIKELWSPAVKAWFPKGVDDPEICLIRVRVETAEYWESPSSPIAHLIGFAKAVLTGERPKLGENERIDVANPQIH
jgi:general stress protein 26